MKQNSPIVVFDSGVGGLSTLAACRELMPEEDYLYYGDTAFAPYGDKTREQVRERVAALAKTFFCEHGAKALVLACNTATSAAAAFLREVWGNSIILGLEPALKPAVEYFGERDILVLATALTLSQEKFQALYQSFASKAAITPVPCPGLMELIEQEEPAEKLESYLRQKLGPDDGRGTVFVLGCTHYLFLKPLLKKLYPEAILEDGNLGAARHLDCLLRQKGLRNLVGSGDLEIDASQDARMFRARCERFLAKLSEKQ